MKKYWKIWTRILQMSLMKDMIYRQDLILGSITAIFYLAIQVAIIAIMFDSLGAKDLAGFNQWDLYLVLIFSQFVFGFIFVFVQGNIRVLMDNIYWGKLDFYILRPIDTFFISFWQSMTLKAGLVIFSYSIILLPYILWKGNYVFDWKEILTIIFVILDSVLIISFLYIISGLIEFFIPRFFGLYWFMNNINDIIKYPKEVYPQFLQFFFLYLCPLFMSYNQIYDLLHKRFGWNNILQMIAMTLLLYLIMTLMWKEGLKRYKSTA